MMKKKTIIASTKTSNIPVLKSKDYTSPAASTTFVYEDKMMGVFAPFEGLFMVKFSSVPTSQGRCAVKLDNIYGHAESVYKGNGNTLAEVDVSEISVGIYLFYFDTDERRLYLVQ